MSILGSVQFIFKEGFYRFRHSRGLSWAVIGIITASLIQMAIVLGLMLFLNQVIQSAQAKFNWTIFLKPHTTTQDMTQLKKILEYYPFIARVKLLTKQQALKDMERDQAIQQMVQALGQNPLLNSFSVLFTPAATSQNLKHLSGQLQTIACISTINYGPKQFNLFSKIIRWVYGIGIVLEIIVFFAALTVMSNAFNLVLQVRKPELQLLHRLGAPAWMKWGPYFWEGIIQGILGSALVLILLNLIQNGVFWFSSSVIFPTNFDIPTFPWRLLDMMIVGIGCLLGVLGIVLALRQKWIKEFL
jgi:cell division protein FtsX